MNKRTGFNIAVFIILIIFILSSHEIGFWLFITIFAYLAIRLLVSIIRFFRRHKRHGFSSQREFIVKLTARFMALSYITGTILLAYTFNTIRGTSASGEIAQFNNTEMIIRSLICSLDFFTPGLDSNIFDRLDSHPVLKGVLVTQAAFSLLCMAGLLVSLIFSRANAYYKLHRRTKITQDRNHLYIFFGINENSHLLATDIKVHDSKSIIVFIDTANINDDENDSWNNIISLFTHRQKTFDFADSSSALVAIASKQLCDIEDSRIQRANYDVLSLAGLEKVKALIENLAIYAVQSQLHIFFLSDNEDTNIRDLITLAKDTTIQATAHGDAVEHRIYCHARYNGPNRVIEDLAVRKNMNVEIIDSSHLAVELLKSKGTNQPVHVAWLSEEHPTTVTRPIESLIVGFGEVGRDAFRFLYEFGTFVQVKDNRFVCSAPDITAIDCNMDGLNGLFKANIPAIKFDETNPTLRLKNLDYHNYEFYSKELSEEKCKSLNYIILALGDDDQNIALATNIFNRIRRFRKDMSHLIIMVRCIREDKLEMMQKIADHYNHGCGDKCLNVIRLFGNPRDIYSYSTIIRDDLTRKGKLFQENYRRLKNEDEDWKKRREKLTGVANRKPGEMIFPNIDKLRKLRRQESQDMSNALHASTKMWLLERSLGRDYNWAGFIARFFNYADMSTRTGAYADITYPHLTPTENSIMLSLAILEHLRWNAAHRLLGYIPNRENHGCDERTQTHNCILEWDELDKESYDASVPGWTADYKAYDFCVVDTSIAIYKDKLGKITTDD